MDKIELEMESTKNSMNDLIAFVEKEDKDRNIRTLDHSKAEQRKFKKLFVKIFYTLKRILKKQLLPTESV